MLKKTAVIIKDIKKMDFSCDDAKNVYICPCIAMTFYYVLFMSRVLFPAKPILTLKDLKRWRVRLFRFEMDKSSTSKIKKKKKKKTSIVKSSQINDNVTIYFFIVFFIGGCTLVFFVS